MKVKVKEEEKILYELIWPYGKKDTVQNAEIIVQSIKSNENYKTVITRAIGYKSKIILLAVIRDPRLDEFRKIVMTEKETFVTSLVNDSLQTDDKEILELVCELFKIKVSLPVYEKLSDILYKPLYYDDDFINTKTNIYYLTDNTTKFEENVTSMQNVYFAGKGINNGDDTRFENVCKCFKFKLNEEDIRVIKRFATDYVEYHDEVFKSVIEDIKNNEEKPDSKSDCWGLLYSYMDRAPSEWEVDILWDHTCDW